MASRRRDDQEESEDSMQPARKVDNQTFVWSVGLLSTLLCAVALWCFNAVAAIRTDVTATNAKLAATDIRISTVVDVGNASAQSLQVTLGRIQTDVDWIKRQLDEQQQSRTRR